MVSKPIFIIFCVSGVGKEALRNTEKPKIICGIATKVNTINIPVLSSTVIMVVSWFDYVLKCLFYNLMYILYKCCYNQGIMRWIVI